MNYKEKIKFEAHLWDSGDWIITANGSPIGMTLDKSTAKRVAIWLPTAIPELINSLPSEKEIAKKVIEEYVDGRYGLAKDVGLVHIEYLYSWLDKEAE